MLGSGENTVAPTSALPSRSFCLAVLNMREFGPCCFVCAGGMSAQQIKINVAISDPQSRTFIERLLGWFFGEERYCSLRRGFLIYVAEEAWGKWETAAASVS